MGGGNPFKKIGEGLGTVFTGGLNKTDLGGGVFRKIGNAVGTGLTLGLGRAGGGQTNSALGAGSGQSPMDMLVNTGGAPLLANIVMGGDIDKAIASFLGIRYEDLSDAYNGNRSILNAQDFSAVQNLKEQLTSIKQNTDLKNKAVQNLVNDFPNYMAQKVPEYAKLMDNETKAMMDQALSKVGAQFAAGGQLSSGATAEAAAKAGADIGMQRLQYGTSLAGQDWQNQYNEANALRNFQMNMLGQQSQNGFNAVQNALQQNTQIGIANANMQNQQNMMDQQQKNAMWQGLGQLGGTVIGGLMGGPFGAAVGSQVGGMATGQSGFMANPRLNLDRPFSQFNYTR